jgi:putative heme-binding domain-containing protein
MYRHLIQGAAFLPPSILKHLDVGAGFDKGRLYRVVPEGFQRPKPPRLGKAPTAELVKLLEHPNGWHRDTAARLLYQRQDRAAVAPLRKLAAEANAPLGRMHALYALDGLRALDASAALRGLGDPDARVREHALRLAEPLASAPEVGARLAQLSDDPDRRVRYQLAFSLGAVPGERPNRALVKLARRDGGDPWLRLAVLSSVHGRAGEVFRQLLADPGFRAAAPGRELLLGLAGVVGSAGRAEEVAAVARGLEALPAGEQPLARAVVRALAARLPAGAAARLAGGKAGELLPGLLRDAQQAAADDQRPAAERAAAVRLLGLAPFAANRERFRELLRPRQPPAVQAAALGALARLDRPEVPALVLEAWPGLSPALRASAAEALFARPAWAAALLDAVEKGAVGRGDLDPARVQLLRGQGDAGLRARAERFLAAAPLAGRREVVAAYRQALRLPGDPARGRAVFKRACAACHQLEGVGTQVGADLRGLRDQGREAVLLNILDPNREVKPQYQSYVLVTDAGRLVTGMITAEGATSVTVRRADGTAETVLRVRIEELRGTGLSFMPEGLEKQIDVPAMADLLTYLLSIK